MKRGTRDAHAWPCGQSEAARQGTDSIACSTERDTSEGERPSASKSRRSTIRSSRLKLRTVPSPRFERGRSDSGFRKTKELLQRCLQDTGTPPAHHKL